MISEREINDAIRICGLASPTQARVLMEILIQFHNVVVPNPQTGRLDSVGSCHLNGKAIQLNVE